MIRARVAAIVAVVDLILFVSTIIVDPNRDYGTILLYLVGISAYVGIGLLLIVRVPSNPIGALMLATGTVAVAAATLGTYADVGSVQVPAWPGVAKARLVADAMFIYPILIALVGIPLVFPDGRLPSRRYRVVVIIWIVGIVGWTVNSVVGTHFDEVVLVAIPVAFAGAVTAVTLRFRRGGPVERAQIKWLAAVVLIGTFGVLSGLGLVDERPEAANALIVIGILALFTMPFVIAIAILRYHLYEIDRIISRGLSYLLITGVLIGAYTAVVLLLSGPLGDATGGDTLSIAISTLVVAALFQPLRRRVQSLVDRRFDRARYDGERMAAVFAAQLRDQIDLGELESDVLTAVGTALRPVSTSVWLRDPSRTASKSTTP
ncbi:MAG: hypothetical protein ACJ769_06665 [Chloroflexota bacterium]